MLFYSYPTTRFTSLPGTKISLTSLFPSKYDLTFSSALAKAITEVWSLAISSLTSSFERTLPLTWTTTVTTVVTTLQGS